MGNNLDALTTVFTEFYYWITLPLMFLIHVGFCMYEVKNQFRCILDPSSCDWIRCLGH